MRLQAQVDRRDRRGGESDADRRPRQRGSPAAENRRDSGWHPASRGRRHHREILGQPARRTSDLRHRSLPDKKDRRGFLAEYFKGTRLEGEPALTRVEEQIQLRSNVPPAPGIPDTDYSVRWTGALTAPATGEYPITFTGDDGFRVFLDDKPILDHWLPGPATTLVANVTLEKNKTASLRVEFFHNAGEAVAQLNWNTPSRPPYAEAVAAARSADVAVVVVSTQRTEGEDTDRTTMDLPSDQANLIRAVAAANRRTIVGVNNGGPVAMKDWIDEVPAVLEAWFPGQEGGAAIAAVLFGDINPSGRLPDTIAAAREDYPDYGNFPGTDGTVKYAEDIYVGYRHFDKRGIAPLFPFGHGLSYTTFEFSNLKLTQSGDPIGTAILASVDVTNTGKRAGDEVVQLYIHDREPKVDKPLRELKGFSRMTLQPRETRTVTFTLTPRDFAYFDTPGRQWKAGASTYDIEVGASSRDIRQRAALKLDADFTEKVPRSKDFSTK